MKLYRVTLRGLSNITGMNYKDSYVVADDPTSAYDMVRKWLDEEDYGFRCDRELASISLIADEEKYNDTQTRLFL